MTTHLSPEQAVKQVICVKWGSLFGPEYVNRLYGMVSRNITPPFRVICLTDDASGIRPEVDCLDLPELGVPHPVNTIGKWRKQVLWSETLPGVSGVVLFVDLDSVIVDSIDPYFQYGEPDDVILARNWARPFSGMGQTSVFRFKVGAHSYIFDAFKQSPQAIADKFRFEQHYVTKSVRGGVKFWPEKWTRHFRLHCLPMFPFRLFMTANIPRGSRIITFPGGPNPDDIVARRWGKIERLPDSGGAHLMAALKEGRGMFRRMRRFFLPVPWIEDCWKE